MIKIPGSIDRPTRSADKPSLWGNIIPLQNDYNVVLTGSKLGKGGMTTVQKGIFIGKGGIEHEVAVKILKIDPQALTASMDGEGTRFVEYADALKVPFPHAEKVGARMIYDHFYDEWLLLRALTEEWEEQVRTGEISKDKHPGFPRVLAYAEPPRHIYSNPNDPRCGTSYIIMERVNGETLREHITKKRTFSVQETISLIGQLLETLQFLGHRPTEGLRRNPWRNRDGILPLDIKTENLMLDESNGKPRLVLLDYGEAMQKREVPELTYGVAYYQGTPAYVPLERALPPASKDDSKTPVGDYSAVFQAGLVMFGLLTGLDYEVLLADYGIESAEGLVNNTLSGKYHKILEKEMKDKKISTQLINFVLKAVARKASDRFANALEMQQQLVNTQSQLETRPILK